MLSAATIKYLQETTILRHFDLNPRSGLFGVELELEGKRLPREAWMWSVHAEGSLRGDAKEYVTQGAVTMGGLEVAMDYLAAAFQDSGARPVNSYRAGTHVHYNMQQRSIDQSIRAIIRWTLLEPVFLKLCGEQRDGNLFCLPTYDTGEMHIWLRNLFEAIRQRKDRIGSHISRGKYAALNSEPLTRFGTLECRSFPCTWDKDTVLLYASLVDCILKEDDTHPRKLLEEAKQKPDNFLRKIFGGHQLPGDALSLLGFGIENAFLMVDTYEEFMG